MEDDTDGEGDEEDGVAAVECDELPEDDAFVFLEEECDATKNPEVLSPKHKLMKYNRFRL